MTGEAIDTFENHSCATQNAGNRWRNVLLREWRDIPVNHNAEALRIDFQPMMSSVSGQVCWPHISTAAIALSRGRAP
jgi:hypothetical protein